MNKKIWLFACLFMSLGIFLASCSPAPAPTTAPTQESQVQKTQPIQPIPSTEAVVSTPASTVSGANPYPAPAAAVEVVTKIDPYPAPKGDKIEWSDVAALLAAGQIADVYQYHNLLVIINLKDGTSKNTTEPAKDDIFKLLDQCGAACSQVIRRTEFFY